MMPIVHMLRRKKKDTSKKNINRSPFVTNPRCGLYGTQNDDAFACTSCDILVGVKDAKSTFRISLEFLVNYEHCDLYFPVSECGNVELMNCRVKGKKVTGSIFRIGKDGKTLIPHTNKEEFFRESDDEEEGKASQKKKKASAKKSSATKDKLSDIDDGESGDDVESSTSDDDDMVEVKEKENTTSGGLRNRSATAASKQTGTSTASKLDALAGEVEEKERVRAAKASKSLTGKERSPTVYTFHIPKISEQLEGPSGFTVGQKIRVQFEVVTQNIVREDDGKYTVPFPLTIVPRSPDQMHYEIEMKSNIRRIISPNKSHPIFPFLKENKAEISLDITPERPIRLGDYMFIVVVELGEPIVPECADPVAILVLVTAVGAMLFYLLTKDLED